MKVDNVVLGIVGRDSSVIKGLNVNDTEEDLNLNLDEGNDDEEAAAGKDIELVSTGALSNILRSTGGALVLVLYEEIAKFTPN
ncbi:hypothetical protein niasHS_001321 [Heterodera schachtii]|uniref:Uncharacterized protein n=1 Tax=Heterodera schachtii TaxID=97005 RepID=A0ABD2KJX1_HETSC